MAINEAEYLRDRKDRWHRVCGVLVALTFSGLALHRGGPELALKSVVYHALPLACICFPRVLARYTGLLPSKASTFKPSHPVALRWAAWFLVLGVPAYFLLLSLLAKSADG